MPRTLTLSHFIDGLVQRFSDVLVSGPLYCYKLLRIPKKFCLYGLHLLIVILLDIKTETFKKYLLIYLKVTKAHYMLT